MPGGFPNLLANGAQGIAVGMATSIPPHNVAELCDAALHLIEKPEAKSKALLKWVKGPDFPTGGIIVDSKESIAEAYITGRGSFRTRAKWNQEEGARGTWVVVITEIPWLVQKSRLVEKIAELLNEKKLPLVGDVRDESAEDVRLVIEPKSRAVDPALMMESLFRLTELESKISLNLNVLVKGRIPKVIGLAECLREWLDHLRDVLLRRSNYPQDPDREPAGSARRLPDRLSEHRQGDQDHPHRGRAEAGADQGVQADGSPGRRHPQHAAALVAQARGIRDPHRGQEPPQRVEGHQVAARLRDRAMVQGRRPGPQGPRHVRAEDAARQAPHHVRRRARARSRRDRGSLRRARAVHGRDLRKGLGPHAEGPCRRSVVARLQDRRQARPRLLRRDHLEASGVRHQRAVLFARRRQTAGRPRPWRADPHVHRHGAGRRDRLAVRQHRRPQVPDRQPSKGRALSSTRTIASATPARASRCSTSRCRTRPARSRPSRATPSP